jgi:excisionase family DNA binding protein
MTQQAPERLAYSIREVAVALGISEAATYKMAARGKLPTVNIGGKKFVEASMLRILLTGKSSQANEQGN